MLSGFIKKGIPPWAEYVHIPSKRSLEIGKNLAGFIRLGTAEWNKTGGNIMKGKARILRISTSAVLQGMPGLDKYQKRIIKKAVKRHSRIHPCGDRRSLRECFTECNGKIVLWFDTDDQSTHAIVE